MTFKLPTSLKLCIGYLTLCACLLVMAGCGNNMRDNSRLQPYEPNAVFANGESERPIDPDTVARGTSTDEALTTGKTGGTEVVNAFPIKVDATVLANGQKTFNIFCTPCHGTAGDGKGVVAGYFNPKPASFYDPRLKAAPVGHFFDVITNGYNIMFSYASRISPQDRWAVIAYIRAIQINQQAPLTVSPDQIQASGAGVTQ